jgi:hypothetical protein
LAGQLLLSSNIAKGSTINYLDTRRLYQGTYIVRLTSGSEVYSQKLMLLK